MASIVEHKDGYRAHVYVKGVRDSEIKRTKREAEAWAVAREKELRNGGSDITLGRAGEEFLKLKLPTLDSEKNRATYEQSIRDYVLRPDYRDKKLLELKRTDLTTMVKDIAEAGKIETADRVAGRIHKIFLWASDQGHIKEEQTFIAQQLGRVLPSADKTPFAAVTVEEIPELMLKISRYPEPGTRLGLQLMAHTFTRTEEFISAQFSEIKDPDTWVIPQERMKGKKSRRKPHVVPLSWQAKQLLEDLRTLRYRVTGNDYFLPSPVNPMCGVSNNTMLYALYSMGYKGRMTGHGFRTVASSGINEQGIDETTGQRFNADAVEKQLAHKETDEVRASYHRALYLAERRRMMQWWSNYLDAAQSRAERALRTAS